MFVLAACIFSNCHHLTHCCWFPFGCSLVACWFATAVDPCQTHSSLCLSPLSCFLLCLTVIASSCHAWVVLFFSLSLSLSFFFAVCLLFLLKRCGTLRKVNEFCLRKGASTSVCVCVCACARLYFAPCSCCCCLSFFLSFSLSFFLSVFCFFPSCFLSWVLYVVCHLRPPPLRRNAKSVGLCR